MWTNLISNSEMEALNLVQPVTDGGKPLLQVCIDNESEDGMWQLRDMMKCLLQRAELNPNVMDFSEKHTMLSYCYVNKKHRAFDMMIKCKYESGDKEG